MCYLVLCEQSFSKRLAYSFLEDLQTEFSSNYGSKVETVSRPYSFIEFGKLRAFDNLTLKAPRINASENVICCK